MICLISHHKQFLISVAYSEWKKKIETFVSSNNSKNWVRSLNSHIKKITKSDFSMD
jgi:hypothetical protein